MANGSDGRFIVVVMAGGCYFYCWVYEACVGAVAKGFYRPPADCMMFYCNMFYCCMFTAIIYCIICTYYCCYCWSW